MSRCLAHAARDVLGVIFAVALQFIVFPVVGLAIPPVQSLAMVGAATAVSFQLLRPLGSLIARIGREATP